VGESQETSGSERAIPLLETRKSLVRHVERAARGGTYVVVEINHPNLVKDALALGAEVIVVLASERNEC